MTITIQESRCSHRVWHLLLARSIGFCSSKSSVQINNTVNMLVKNINRLLTFFHNHFRHNSKSQKYKVMPKRQKITSLRLCKYFSMNKVLFIFMNALSETLYNNTFIKILFVLICCCKFDLLIFSYLKCMIYWLQMFLRLSRGVLVGVEINCFLLKHNISQQIFLLML